MTKYAVFCQNRLNIGTPDFIYEDGQTGFIEK
jgi:hypothetical protein